MQSHPRSGPLLGALWLLLLLSACPRPEAVAAPGGPPAVRESVEVMAPGGERTLRLEGDASGYVLVDRAGWPIGQAIIDKRSVRVTDREGLTLVTVTRTSDGFALEDGQAGPPLIGEQQDEGLALSRGGQRLAAFRDHALSLGAETLTVIANDAYAQVQRDGRTVLEVRGGRVGDGAAYLAWTALPFPERLALMVFAAELL